MKDLELDYIESWDETWMPMVGMDAPLDDV